MPDHEIISALVGLCIILVGLGYHDVSRRIRSIEKRQRLVLSALVALANGGEISAGVKQAILLAIESGGD